MKPSPLKKLRDFATKFSSSIRGGDPSIHDEGAVEAGAVDARTRKSSSLPPVTDPGRSRLHKSGLGEADEDTEKPAQGIVGTPPDELEEQIYADSTINDLRTAVQTSEVPQTVDHFEIRRVLGQGGFGSVFLAHDTKLERMVALKLLDKVERSAARRMLEYETRAASKLRHPNLVTVFQSGETKQGCYIVFEYVPGPEPENAQTLRELLNSEKRIDPKLAVEFIRQATEGLAYAHGLDVVHRDIKPENILIDFKGMAYLADFGCARQRKRYSENLKSLVGTLPYMSLEQINGQWNAQTDVWSIGVVLYEILSGKRPFHFAEQANSRSASEAAFSYAVAVLDSEVKPIDGVDADLMAVCKKCLEPKADERYQTAESLLEDLQRWQRNEPVSCRPISIVERTTRWAKRNPVIATLLGTVAATLIVGMLVSSYFATNFWNSRRQYVSDQIAEFAKFDSETFDARVTTLANEPFRDASLDALASEWQSSSQSRHRDRIAAALLRFSRSEAGSRPSPAVVSEAKEQLLQTMLSTDDPAEFRFLYQELVAGVPGAPFDSPIDRVLPKEKDELAESLWSVASQGEHGSERIRALIALSQFQPNDERWTADALDRLTDGLLGFEAKQIGAWTALSTGVGDRLMPLIMAEKQSDDVRRRDRAERAYVALATSPVEKAHRLIRASSPELIRELLFDLQMLEPNSEERQAISGVLNDRRAGKTPRQLANQSLAKLALDGPADAQQFSVFDAASSEESRRYFELNAARIDMSPQTMLDWLQRMVANRHDVAATRTALLALGHFDVNSMSDSVRDQLVDQAKALCLGNADAGIHAACLRVLRQWNQDGELSETHVAKTDAAKTDGDRADGDRAWRINALGHLMVRVPLSNGKTCEVSAHEITVGDYAAYVRSRVAFYDGRELNRVTILRRPLIGHFENHDVNGVPDVAVIEDAIPLDQQRLPITEVGALQALAYCAWVSEQTEVAPEQMCFKVNGKKASESTLEAIERQIKVGDVSAPILDVARDQTGYRLPFLDEWQSLISTVPTQLALRQDEGWFESNSEGRLHVVGTKRPNELGLFDVTGNVSEWFLRREIANPGDDNAREIITVGAAGGRYDAELSDRIMPIEDPLQVFIGGNVIGYRVFRMLE